MSTWVPSIKSWTLVPSVWMTTRWSPVCSVDDRTVVTVWFVPPARTTGLVPVVSRYQPVPPAVVLSRHIGIPAALPVPSRNQNPTPTAPAAAGVAMTPVTPSVVTAVPASLTIRDALRVTVPLYDPADPTAAAATVPDVSSRV
jgi:hypothetical protein